VKIPRGVPRQDNVATIQRGISALGSQLQSVRRQSAEDQAEARGLQQLGAAITDTAAAIQRQGIRLDAKAQAELDRLANERRAADRAAIAASLSERHGALKAEAISEHRAITQDEMDSLPAGLEGALGAERFTTAMADEETAAYVDNTMRRLQGDNLVATARIESEQAKSQNTDAAYRLMDAGEFDVAKQVVDSYPGYTSHERKVRKNLIERQEIDTRSTALVGEVAAILANDDLPMADRREDAASMVEQIMNRANLSDAVKEAFSAKQTTALSRWERMERDKNALTFEEGRHALLNRAAVDLTQDELDVAWTNRDLNGLTQTVYDQIKTVITRRLEGEATAIEVDQNIIDGRIMVGPKAQSKVDAAFSAGENSREAVMLKPEPLTDLERNYVTNPLRTGRVPKAFANMLDMAMTGAPENTLRALELYRWGAARQGTRTGLNQLPQATLSFYETVSAKVAAGVPAVDAISDVQAFRALPEAQKAEAGKRYTQEKADNTEAFTERWNQAAQDYEHVVKGNVGDLEIPPVILDKYNAKVREQYLLGNDLTGAQNGAFREMLNAVGVTAINGDKRLVEHAPEEYYQQSTQAIQRDLIRDANALGIPSDARLSLQADDATERGGGHKFLYTDANGMWQIMRDETATPVRYYYTGLTAEEEAAAATTLQENMERWRREHNTLMEAQELVDPANIYQNVGYPHPGSLEDYLEERVNEATMGQMQDRF
jgi:hypothetical protein